MRYLVKYITKEEASVLQALGAKRTDTWAVLNYPSYLPVGHKFWSWPNVHRQNLTTKLPKYVASYVLLSPTPPQVLNGN